MEYKNRLNIDEIYASLKLRMKWHKNKRNQLSSLGKYLRRNFVCICEMNEKLYIVIVTLLNNQYKIHFPVFKSSSDVNIKICV